jgi:hypothetical protein
MPRVCDIKFEKSNLKNPTKFYYALREQRYILILNGGGSQRAIELLQ